MRLGDLDDLKDHISELMLIYTGTELNNAILQAIDNAPTVDTFTFDDMKKGINVGYKAGKLTEKWERPQGKWVKIFENPFTNGYVCPFCGYKIQVTEQFLPEVTECENCGAKMT